MAAIKPNIDRNGSVAAQALDLSFLESAQQLGLQIERKFADFVQEECPLVCKFEAAHFARDGPGKRTFLVAEQFAFDQPGGNGSAIDLDERAVFTTAEAMDGARKQFLAGSRFTLDEDRCIRGSHGFNLLENLAQTAALADDVFEAVLEIDLLLQILLLLAKAVAEFGDLAEHHGIADGHGHLVADLDQHVGLALRVSALDPAGDRQRADELAAMHKWYPAARLHPEARQMPNTLFRKAAIFDTTEADRFPGEKCLPGRRPVNGNSDVAAAGLFIGNVQELDQDKIGALLQPVQEWRSPAALLPAGSRKWPPAASAHPCWPAAPG